MRYTSRQMSVTENFSQRSSGSLNTFIQLGSRNMGGSGLDGSARLLDLHARGCGYRHALDDELPGHVSQAEQLDGMIGPADEPGAEQGIRGHLDALGERAELAHVHDLGGLLERVCEAAFGDAPDERHLPALEPGPRAASAAR